MGVVLGAVQPDDHLLWDASYDKGDNLLFWPNEEIVRFVSKYVVTRTGVSSYSRITGTGEIRALDFGCGAGRHLLFLNGLGIKAFGVDISEKSLEIARDLVRLEAAGSELSQDAGSRILRTDGRLIPFPDNFFDFAVSHGVLDSMSWKAAEQSVRELSRVLAPNGLLYTDLISGENSQFETPVSGERIQTGPHETGTTQLYFNIESATELLSSEFLIEDYYLVSTRNFLKESFGGRYSFILRKRHSS